MADRYDVQFVTIHGHRRAYVRAGSGPVVLLLHGLGCDHTTWDPVIESLSRRYTVIAPDLLGHGQSDKPRADYSVGGYANGMRDLLTVLGIDKVTVIGHSFGGGVAMQFAYQFPERTERLMLVSSGGLGPEVAPAIRAITTPGFHEVMGVLTLPGIRHLGIAGLRSLSALGWKSTRDLDEVAEVFDTLQGPRRAARDPARRARRRRLARPDRDDGRPRLPHRGDADVGRVGPRRPGDPGPARLAGRPGRAELPRRGDPRRRATSRTRTTRTASAGSCTTSSAPPSRRSTPGRGSARCSRTAPRRPRPRRCARSRTSVLTVRRRAVIRVDHRPPSSMPAVAD